MPTPMATGTLTFSTPPPQQRLCHTPSMNTYGYSCSNGRSRHSSMSEYTFLSLSLNVCEGMWSPHNSWLTSSTCRVPTPARYMSTKASPGALLTTPAAFDHRRGEHRALELGHLKAHSAGLDGQVPIAVAGPVRPAVPLRSYLAAPVISSA